MRRGAVQQSYSVADQFMLDQGREVGERAREVFPEGILIDDVRLTKAAERTNDLINDSKISVIFEATFVIGNYAAKADILKRNGNKWEMIEVKSSTNDKPEFIDDMAYTTMILECGGINLSKISIMLISKDFRLGMDTSSLFREIDHTEEVKQRTELFRQYFKAVEESTASPRQPEPRLRFDCKKCDLFPTCQGGGIDNHIFDIPRLSQKKFDELVNLGIVCIEDIPPGFTLTDNQKKVVDCAKCGEILLDDSLQGKLDQVVWPAYYLDFETTMTAIPLYPGIAPYDKIPIQYSIHTCSQCGEITNHVEYLADPGQDCRRELAERLIENLEGDGSILVYSSFEKTVVNELARVFPDLSEKLQSLITRLVDLEKIVKSINHPQFRGKTSIKVALPAMVPDMSYEHLEIADGAAAMATFAYMAQEFFEAEEAEKKKGEMLEYCKQDTLAMVRLHEALTHIRRTR